MKTKNGKIYSQLAGSLYLLIAVIGGISIGYIPGEIIAEGDASLTFQNLVDNQTLFKWGIAGDISVMVLETILTVMLFKLFKSVSTTGITIATFARLAMAIIMALNLINYMIPAILMTQPAFMDSFTLGQLQSLILLFFKAHKYGEFAWQLFFAIHLVTLGYVLNRSKFSSSWLSTLMSIGGIGYGGDAFIRFVQIDHMYVSLAFSSLLVLAVISEFWFAFWLLIKGVNMNVINKPN